MNAAGRRSTWIAGPVTRPPTSPASSEPPGGAMVLHEYGDDRAWRWSPVAPEFLWFVDEVMACWREHGGELDIGLEVIAVKR